MASWVLKGLRTGIKSSPYPARADDSAGVSPGRPQGITLSPEEAERLVRRCAAGAIARQDGRVLVEQGNCVHCFRCHPDAGSPAAAWEAGYEWAAYAAD